MNECSRETRAIYYKTTPEPRKKPARREVHCSAQCSRGKGTKDTTFSPARSSQLAPLLSSPLLGRKEMATTRVLVLAAVLAASLLAAGTAAQSTDAPAECANKLVGCAAYMNGTDAETPPDTCCGPLRDAVKNEKPCLCALYASPEIFKAFHINLTDALRLSKRCGISEDTSSCPSKYSTLPSPPFVLSNLFWSNFLQCIFSQIRFSTI
uniref:Uncharacterized protein n=1 Tax=Avena sativa TaxID=4498 RepID=A0ACD6A7J3_AVESA